MDKNLHLTCGRELPFSCSPTYVQSVTFIDTTLAAVCLRVVHRTLRVSVLWRVCRPVSSHFGGTCRILSGLERVSCQWARTCQLSVG